MATGCSAQGITILEIDAQGRALNVQTGYGHAWKRTALDPAQGSPEWLSEIVIAPTPSTLQSAIADIAAKGVFLGESGPGTSITSAQTAVYRVDGGQAPSVSPDDHRYYVLAQGLWVDETTGAPLQNVPADIGPNSIYIASSFLISESPIANVPTLASTWEASREQGTDWFDRR